MWVWMYSQHTDSLEKLQGTSHGLARVHSLRVGSICEVQFRQAPTSPERIGVGRWLLASAVCPQDLVLHDRVAVLIQYVGAEGEEPNPIQQDADDCEWKQLPVNSTWGIASLAWLHDRIRHNLAIRIPLRGLGRDTCECLHRRSAEVEVQKVQQDNRHCYDVIEDLARCRLALALDTNHKQVLSAEKA